MVKKTDKDDLAYIDSSKKIAKFYDEETNLKSALEFDKKRLK